MRSVYVVVGFDFGVKKVVTRDKPYVLVSSFKGVFVGFLNDFHSAIKHRALGRTVGTRHKEDGSIGVLCTEFKEHTLVRFLKILGRFCVVVVVVNEDTGLKRCNVSGNRRLCLCRAGKSEVRIVEIKPAREVVLINHTGARRTHTLRYGRAVEKNGCVKSVVGRRGYHSTLVNADIKRAYSARKGEVQGHNVLS